MAGFGAAARTLGRSQVRKKRWEQKAVKHPGIEIAKARRNGITTRQQLQRDAKSDNPKIAARGRLGLRFEAQARNR